MDINLIKQYYDAEQIRSGSKNREIVGKSKGKYDPAYTMYIGSRKSEKFIRIYDKAKEQHNPQFNPDGYNSHWIRVEMVFRRDHAAYVMDMLIKAGQKGQILGETVAEMINGYMQFIEPDDSNISRCSVASWWTGFLETVKKIKVAVAKPVNHVYERSVQYFKAYQAPLVATIRVGMGETAFNYMMIEAMQRQSGKQEKMLRAYRQEPIHRGLTDILGSGFARTVEKLIHNPFTQAQYDEMIRQGKSRGERTLMKVLSGLPKVPDKQWEQMQMVPLMM